MPGYNTKVLYMRNLIVQSISKLWEYPLTVVEAPMGYGKTTAVKEILENHQANILWQTLLDGSVTGFWSDFSQLMRKVDIACSEKLAEMDFPHNSRFIREAVYLLENIVFPNKTVLVFDDYHLLTSTHIDQFIETLAKVNPPGLHIVIISRTVFGENMTELALKGYCHIVDKSHFELNQEEIAEYYKLCGIQLNPWEINMLYFYTEGWISALYLCMLSFLEDGRIEQQASLHELIEKVVYRQCSATVKAFLTTISIFDTFTLEQAEYMWGQKDTHKILKELMANNAFIKYDKINRTYQIHNIFTSYLRDIVNRQHDQQALFATAGNWYVKIHDYIRAMNYFYKAGDFDSLLIAIELDRGNSINPEHKELIIRYFAECPTEIKHNHVQACLIYAINLFSFNENQRFAEQCYEIAQYIEDRLGHIPAKQQLAGELELLLSFTKYNRIADMSEHHQRACQLLNGPSEFLDSKGSWTFGSPSVLYMFHRESGQLNQEVNELIELIPHYYQLTNGHGSGAEYVMQAETYYHTGDLENAEITLHKALYSARSHQQLAIVLCVMFLQTKLAVMKGDLAQAANTLQQMNDVVRNSGCYSYFHTVDLCEGSFYADLNQAEKIPGWITAGNVEDSCLCFPSYAFFNMVYGKTLLAGKQYHKLLGNAGQFIDLANLFPNLLSHIYIHIYIAAAQYKLGHLQKAEAALKQALSASLPDHLIMPFVENGEYILQLLPELEKITEYRNFIKKIRNIHAKIAVKLTIMKTDNTVNLTTLTERERQIAEQVAAGLSNSVIAKNLYIAEITVKKALQNIYSKLSISNRTALTKIIIEQKQGD